MLIIFISATTYAQFGRKNISDETGINKLNASPTDTAKADVTRTNKATIINLKIYATDFNNTIKQLDTSILNLHTKMGLAYWQQNLGNVNSAVYNLKYIAPYYTTKQLGNNHYSAYNISMDSVQFYNTTNPYTEMRYNAGSKLEQGVSVLHTQNMNAFNNFSFSYAKYGGPGYFDLQRATRDNASISMLYRPSAHSRYSGRFAVVYNQNKQDENGGIQDELDLTLVQYRLRQTIPVNYGGQGFSVTSSTIKNRYRQAGFKFKNMYALSFDNQASDSSNRKPNVQVFYTFNANLEKQDFIDANPISNTYKEIYNGNFLSKDSVRATHVLNTLQNEFGIQLPYVKKVKASLEAIFGIETQQYKLYTGRNTIFNNYVSAHLANVDTNAKWQYSAFAKLYLLGQAAGTYAVDAHAGRTIRNNNLAVHFRQNLMQAPYLMQQYASNFYGWQHNFKNQLNTTIGASLSLPKIKTYLAFNNITMLNHLYYTDSMQVKLASNGIVILQLQGRKEINFRKWNATLDAILQQANANSQINIPAITANVNIGYTNYIFKRSMLANIGVQAIYNTAYTTAQYLPLINAYGYGTTYLQNNLPNMGVFFNGKIKRFRYSLQLLELQQPFNLGNIRTEAGFNRILVEKYPAPDWQIKLGFAWVFLN